jgi:hypothetical protein
VGYTNTQQANNARSNIKIEIDGVSKSLVGWADYFGLNEQTVYTRYSEAGDRDPKILFRPTPAMLNKKEEQHCA